jgi:hypothetical protein
MIAIAEEQLRKFAPKAIPEYLETFRNGEDVLTRYGINANGRRVASRIPFTAVPGERRTSAISSRKTGGAIVDGG